MRSARRANEIRAVIDTNLWVSAFLNQHGLPRQLLVAFQEQRFTHVTSEPLLAELADVLVRPRLVRRHRGNAVTVEAFVESLQQGADLVSLVGAVHICRDPADDMVIETAILGSSHCLVSGDQDTHSREVIEYLTRRGIRVLTVREFLADLGAQEGVP